MTALNVTLYAAISTALTSLGILAAVFWVPDTSGALVFGIIAAYLLAIPFTALAQSFVFKLRDYADFA